MGANLPQTLDGVQRLYEKLRREGFVRITAGLVVGQFVQCQRRGITLCGTLEGSLPARDDRPQRFIVITSVGDLFVAPANVRACEGAGDGRCTCAVAAREGAAGAHGRRLGAGFTAPLGNTGVTA